MKKYLHRYIGAIAVFAAMSIQMANAQSVSFSEPKFSDPSGAASFGYKGAAKSGSTFYAIEKSDLSFNQNSSFPDTLLIKNVEIKLIDADKESEIKTVYKDSVFSKADIAVSSLSVGKYKLQARVSTSTKVGKKDTTYVFTGANIFDIQKTPSASFKVSGTIKTIKGFTIDYYSHSGGFENGWTFTIDGKSPDNLNNPGKEPIEQSSKLAIVNECNGVQWFKKEMDAKVIIYPDPTVPAAESSSYNQCTPSETVILKVSKGDGYLGSWKYQWYDNGNKISGATGLETIFSANPSWSNGYSKEVDSHKIELEYTFTLDTGETLLKNTVPFTVNVYKKPTMPSRIVLKGNGTSHTYIALFDYLSDNDLRDYDFAFKFGDGEAEHETLNRYFSFNATPGDPWVQTMWIYDDNFKTYSDVLYLDSSSRGTTDITSLQSEEISIVVEGLNYAVYGAKSCSIRILSAQGRLIKQEDVSLKSDHIEGSLDIEGLPTGIYMVTYTCDSLQKTSKIYIH